VEARDRQTDGQDQHMMGPPSRKDGPIINRPKYGCMRCHRLSAFRYQV